MVKLTDEEIDEKVEVYKKGLTASQRQAFDDISSNTGTRSYVSKSKKNLTKAFNKIKKNVQKAYPSDGSPSGFEKPDKGADKKPFDLPKPKSEKKPKAEKKPVEGKLQNKPAVPKKIRRKLTLEKKKETLKAPSGRKYSPTELREGLGSKRAKEWRKKNKIPAKDYTPAKKNKPKSKSKK